VFLTHGIQFILQGLRLRVRDAEFSSLKARGVEISKNRAEEPTYQGAAGGTWAPEGSPRGAPGASGTACTCGRPAPRARETNPRIP
jgi:hypothetical protein